VSVQCAVRRTSDDVSEGAAPIDPKLPTRAHGLGGGVIRVRIDRLLDLDPEPRNGTCD
jgi:hypothetical protein